MLMKYPLTCYYSTSTKDFSVYSVSAHLNLEKILNFMQNGQTDREIMHFKYIYFYIFILAGISVHGDFEVIFRRKE